MAGIFLAYSLLASTLLIVIWAVYKCVLANTGCFRFNRILLLSCITLAFVFPIFILNSFWVADIMENNIEIAFNPVEIAYIANTVSEQITPIWDYIVTLFLIGVIVMILYFLVSLVRLALFILKGEHIKQDDCRIILHRHNSVAPFAWCGYVMMPRRDWYEFGQMIVCHEKAHIECRHWIDLLFMQAAIIITWYCPAIWLLRNELHTLHEYEADSRVLASGVKREEYQMFLIKKTVGARFATLSNCLNHSSLKKRITMMMKRKTPGWKRLYILIAFPLAAGAVFVFAQPKVDATLQTVVAGQATACDSSSLDISLSAADYAGLAADAVAFDVYVNQRNQLMIGAFNKMDAVKLEGLADAVSKRLVADFSSRYAKRKEVPEMVACITADRNAKMGCVYEAKQQISRGYELAVRELSATYPAGVLQHSLSSRIVYNPPRSYGNPVAGVSDKNQRLEGFGITIFMEGEKKGSLKDFTLQELESEIASLLEGADVSKNMISVELSVPKDVQEGIMYDVKQVLRKLYLLKVDTVH